MAWAPSPHGWDCVPSRAPLLPELYPYMVWVVSLRGRFYFKRHRCWPLQPPESRQTAAAAAGPGLSLCILLCVTGEQFIGLKLSNSASLIS